MKKFLAMLLAACMVLSLAACGSKEEPKQDDQQGGAQDTQEAQFDENGYMKMDESYLSMAAGSAGGAPEPVESGSAASGPARRFPGASGASAGPRTDSGGDSPAGRSGRF